MKRCHCTSLKTQLFSAMQDSADLHRLREHELFGSDSDSDSHSSTGRIAATPMAGCARGSERAEKAAEPCAGLGMAAARPRTWRVGRAACRERGSKGGGGPFFFSLVGGPRTHYSAVELGITAQASCNG